MLQIWHIWSKHKYLTELPIYFQSQHYFAVTNVSFHRFRTNTKMYFFDDDIIKFIAHWGLVQAVWRRFQILKAINFGICVKPSEIWNKMEFTNSFHPVLNCYRLSNGFKNSSCIESNFHVSVYFFFLGAGVLAAVNILKNSMSVVQSATDANP